MSAVGILAEAISNQYEYLRMMQSSTKMQRRLPVVIGLDQTDLLPIISLTEGSVHHA